MKHRHISHAATPALEWISDLSGKTARITSIGSHSVLVENHCGIQQFSQEQICLATRCGMICVQGAQLTLAEVRSDALVIRGKIRHVDLPCGEVDHES